MSKRHHFIQSSISFNLWFIYYVSWTHFTTHSLLEFIYDTWRRNSIYHFVCVLKSSTDYNPHFATERHTTTVSHWTKYSSNKTKHMHSKMSLILLLNIQMYVHKRHATKKTKTMSFLSCFGCERVSYTLVFLFGFCPMDAVEIKWNPPNLFSKQ